LPASPQIFLGRESELSAIVSTLIGNPALVAILGAGGMGKTSLAVAALHHPAISDKYSERHFISCESANTNTELVATIASHLGLEPAPGLSRLVVNYLSGLGPILFVLDNLETPWEPVDSRADVEAFLTLLAEIPTLTLLVTMRGAERPGRIKWTRPFLPPLEPLALDASRQIFTEIADAPAAEDEQVLVKLVELSGNVPLALSLLASVVSFEGYRGALNRWNTENTSLLSAGHDKRSNLEKSFVLSLGSPRIASSPYAQNFLALLSLLPDGITEETLAVSKVAIPDLARC
ncbi:P-loop containing nucleoside triphosphate hydrolase protein, partial [Mycena leptocephala]